MKATKIVVARHRALTQDAPGPIDHDDDREAIERALHTALDFGESEAAALVAKVDQHNKHQLIRSLALEIPELSKRNTLRLARLTVQTIRGIAPRLAKRLAPLISRATTRGLRGEAFADLVAKVLKVERKAAKRIAIGQVIRINAQVTEQRHVALGIVEYDWHTVQDGHARKWHRDLHTTRHRYDTPPEGGGGGPHDRGHPGSADVCRCQQIAVIPRKADNDARRAAKKVSANRNNRRTRNG